MIYSTCKNWVFSYPSWETTRGDRFSLAFTLTFSLSKTDGDSKFQTGGMLQIRKYLVTLCCLLWNTLGPVGLVTVNFELNAHASKRVFGHCQSRCVAIPQRYACIHLCMRCSHHRIQVVSNGTEANAFGMFFFDISVSVIQIGC